MTSQPPSSPGGAGGERIVAIEVRDEMRRSFMEYAMSVIISRAIPDARDGLKPVHRRIIFGMNELNLAPTERHKKSANAVGFVMGNYHPHGDSAIYEALVRLAQPSASRYTLVDGSGNFGDLDNPPAAMRYTEARLSQMSMEMLEDIDAETVDMRPNYDDSKKEPVVLPSRVPTLLLNGSAGIAVGMATNIPPHNLTEVIDGLIQFIDHPEWMEEKDEQDDLNSRKYAAIKTSKRLMQWIKGPDFPIGGVIMGTEGIVDAYTTGRGSVPVRGDAVIEQLSGTGRQTRMAIIVTSLPYMIGPEAFAKRVAELVREEKLGGISDVNDETDRNGIRVVMELRRDAHPEVVLNNLYKHTQLQQSFPVNTLALIRTYASGSTESAFQPATLCLADLLQEFQDHRIEVITRRTRYFLKKAEDRAHILEGYLKALTNIDKVIATIRAASATEEARTALMAEFQLTELQANAILEMQLRRLTGLERGKIEKEYQEIQDRIAELKKILSERQLVLDIIKKELLEIRHKYGGDKDPRRTRIEGSYEQLSSKDLTPNDAMAIFITKQDYIKRMPLDTFKRQRRNTRGVTGVKTKGEDDLQHFFSANMHDRLLVFTTKGSVYSLEVMDLPEGGRTARGTALVNLLSIGQEESVTAVIPVATFSEDSYLIMLTHQAYIKKVQMSDLANIRRSGIISITLNDGDELGWVRPSTGKADVLIGTGDGMCIRYSEDELRPMGRTARGVRAITLREGDSIVGFDVIEPGTEAHVLVVTTDGFGKRVKLDEFRQQGRGGIGLIGTKFKNAHSRLATLRLVSEAEEVMIATLNGIVVRQNVSEISIQGRMATGVRIQQLGEDDQVMSVTPLVEPDADAAGDGPADGAPAAE